MGYEITEKISDDLIINNAITENMQDIANLRNTLEMQQRLIENLSNRVDYFNLVLSEKTITIESRL